MDKEGKPKPCSCPEIKAAAIEPVVWDSVCQLIKDPDFLIAELHKHDGDSSQTKEILERELKLCQSRLKAIPHEQMRLVEGYRKGLYTDFMMREDMEQIQKERDDLKKRSADLEAQLARRPISEAQEAQIRNMALMVSAGLDSLDFAGRQQLLRLLVEKILYNGQDIEILTIIPFEKLHPIYRRG